MAGYSKRSLVDKLGIKPGDRIYVMNAPVDYKSLVGTLPEGAKLLRTRQNSCEFIHFFTKQRSDLKSVFPTLRKCLTADGTLWISWPKGASKVPTDLNENVVRVDI